MNWVVGIASVILLAAILGGPFLISTNSLAQGLFGLLTTAIATGIGVFASWQHSKSSDKERLTRYGLLAWRNIDALSVKVRQQIQIGSAKPEVMESWLLDIDQAKWGWRDLLRELFELQERLQLEREEVALRYKEKIDAAENEQERANLEKKLRLELAKISGRAPLPIAETEKVDCPNCGNSVAVVLGGEVGATAWPSCKGCGALFPVHRKSEQEITVNADAMKLLTKRACPHCGADQEWKIPANKSVRFLFSCPTCHGTMQCEGDAGNFSVRVPEEGHG